MTGGAPIEDEPASAAGNSTDDERSVGDERQSLSRDKERPAPGSDTEQSTPGGNKEQPPPTGDDTTPALHRRTSLRLSGGWVGFDGAALYLRREDELARVAFENVVDVSYEDYDYFLVVLSLVLVGFGLWFVREHPASLLFSLAGLGSLWRLYRRRGAVTVRVRNRARQLTFHPVDGAAFYDALGEEMDAAVVSARLTFRGR